jgi:hypothetical protein
MSFSARAPGRLWENLAMLGLSRVFAIAAAVGLLAPACGESEPPELIVPTGLELSWDIVPHRISVLELSFDPSSSPPMVTAENDGGTWGGVDTPRLRVDTRPATHPGLAGYAGSTLLTISAEDAGTARTEVRVPAAELGSSAVAAAVLRGYRIDTDLYDTPPPFENDPDLPYDPADGFTTSGVGFSLTQPTRDGDDWLFTVAATNRLSPADRGDMNAAMPAATTWVRVDWLLLGGANDVGVSEGRTDYFMSYPDYGKATEHPHAPAEAQIVSFEPMPGANPIAAGIAAFDIAVNVPDRIEAGCVVVQDEINSWGEEISGPGRYLTSVSAILADVTVDPATGEASGRLDMHFSNTSKALEVGNLCIHAEGTAVLLRSAEASGGWPTPDTFIREFYAGEPFAAELGSESE